MRKTKNQTTLLILTAIVVALLSACELETSDCGRIGGFWQLHTIEAFGIDSSAPSSSSDMRNLGVTWSFQGTIMQVKCYKVIDYYYLSFEDRGDSLHLFSPYRADRDQGLDVPITNADTLRFMGIPAINTTFAIRQLNSSTMVLQNDTLRLHLRKY